VDPGVVEQVVDHLTQSRGVAGDPDRIVGDQVYRPIRLDRPRALDGIRRDRREVERLALERTALVESGQQQQFIDQDPHP
jgi:hypothetical protein